MQERAEPSAAEPRSDAPKPAAPVPVGATAGLLALQRSAGNGAVNALLGSRGAVAPGGGVVRRAFQSQPATTGNAQQWRDDGNVLYDEVADADDMRVDDTRWIQEVGNINAVPFRIVQGADGTWDRSPDDAPFAPEGVDDKDDADVDWSGNDQLEEQGFRLARFASGFTVQVDVAPVANGIIDMNVPVPQRTYAANEVRVLAIVVGNNDRPPTFLEPKKRGGSIPQGRHIVAWSAMRRSYAAHAGLSAGDLMRRLVQDIQRVEAHLPEGGEGEFINQQLKVALPGAAGALMTVALLLKGRLPITGWQHNLCELTRIAANLHHLSTLATFTGKSTNNDESGGLGTLAAADQALVDGEDIDLDPLPAAAELILDITQAIEANLFVEAIQLWISTLEDLCPTLMAKHGAHVASAVLDRPVTGKGHLEALGPFPPTNPTVQTLLAHFQKPGTANLGKPTRQRPPKLPDAVAAFDLSGRGDFVASVDLAIDSAGQDGSTASGRDGTTPVAAEHYFAGGLMVADILVSDLDRPHTKSGKLQNSHTVAWTLLRAELASLAGRSAWDLLLFLEAELKALKGDLRNDFAPLWNHATREWDRIANACRPIHLWQSDLSLLVVWYAHLHQAANSTTFYDARTHGPKSHGEPQHMKRLRQAEEDLDNDLNINDEEALIEAACTLLDVSHVQPRDDVRQAVGRWRRALERTFPLVWKRFGKRIEDHALAADIGDAQTSITLGKMVA